MLNWVVKVVPQPPEPPPKKVDEEKKEKPPVAPPPVIEKKVTFEDELKNEAPKQEVQAAEGNSPAPGSQPGVMTWISGALPQPAVLPKPSQTNSTTKEETTTSKPEDKTGMMAWIAQGLEKVVPQPDLKIKESPAAAEQVCPAAAAPSESATGGSATGGSATGGSATAAEPQVTVVKAEPDREDKPDNKPLPPRMMDWIKQGIEKVVPQPEVHVCSKAEVTQKTEAPPPPKAEEAAAAEPPPAPRPDAHSVVGWIVTGIGRMLPQPVLKQDAGSDEVQSRGKTARAL